MILGVGLGFFLILFVLLSPTLSSWEDKAGWKDAPCQLLPYFSRRISHSSPSVPTLPLQLARCRRGLGAAVPRYLQHLQALLPVLPASIIPLQDPASITSPQYLLPPGSPPSSITSSQEHLPPMSPPTRITSSQHHLLPGSQTSRITSNQDPLLPASPTFNVTSLQDYLPPKTPPSSNTSI